MSASRVAEPEAGVPTPGLIRVRIRTLRQLYNSMDPSPFQERDLDPDAEAFIVDWARELDPHEPVSIRVELGEEEAPEAALAQVREALGAFFTRAAELQGHRLSRLLREGRLSLLIGLAFLAACLSLSAAVTGAARGALASVVAEGLVIGGWVAMWRPMEIFLYEWWPIVRERRLYRRLASARVELTGTPARAPAP